MVEKRLSMDRELLNQPIQLETRVPKTREEYDAMTQDEMVEYSRKYGEKIQSCHKSDKNHRYPCSWCRQVPDETRIYVSKDRKDARYLCYRCVTEEDQLKEWTELQETSYWLPIAPPKVPQFNTPEDPNLTCFASPATEEQKRSLLSIPMPSNAPFRPFQMEALPEEENERKKRRK